MTTATSAGSRPEEELLDGPPSQKETDEQTYDGANTATDGLPPQQLRGGVPNDLGDLDDRLNLRSLREPPRRRVPRQHRGHDK